jgi:hypothetical protein
MDCHHKNTFKALKIQHKGVKQKIIMNFQYFLNEKIKFHNLFDSV